MKGRIRQVASVGAVLFAFALLPAKAQDGQTADSAQKFLAAMAKKGLLQAKFVDATGRNNYVTGKYTGEVKRIKGSGFSSKTKETIEAFPERFVDKQLNDVRAAVLDAIGVDGRPNACMTRISQVTAPYYDEYKSDAGNDTGTFTFTLTYTSEEWKYEPLAKFMDPAQVIDWSDARVNRSPDGSIGVTAKGQSFPTIQLTYAAGDPDLADRIEYAMKFLLMSCDATAETGF